MINLINVTKSFKNEMVLKGIDLELPNNGLITILGETGCGKTTLLNILGGLDKPTSGEIIYDGKKTSNIDSYREENISYIFQNSFLFKNSTVYDNLYEYLLLMGITDKDEVERRINQALGIVKLKKYKKHFVNDLSSGEQQRVAIARALLRENKIIFADEPTGNLDIDNARIVMEALKIISKKSLVVLVTHNNGLAVNYSDKIYKIENGKLMSDYFPLDNSLDSSNIIYEADFSKKIINSDNININAFDINNLDINFYSINGQLYYKTNQKIKNIDDSPYQILKEKNEIIRKNIDTTLEYKDTFIKKHSFKEISLYLFNNSKINIINRFFLVIIGLLLFCLSYFLILSTNVDESKIRYTDTAYVVNNNILNDGKENYLDSSKLEDLLIDFRAVDLVEEKVFDFYLFKNSFVKGKCEKAIYVPIEYNNKNVIYGKNILDNSDEVIISKALAVSLKDSISLEDILNYSLNINNTKTNKKIVGISDSNLYEVFYLNDYSYLIGTKTYFFNGEYKNTRILEDYSQFDLTLTRGELPKRKNEILAFDDGKTELLSKVGAFIISGFFKFDDSFLEDKYEYVLSINSTIYKEEYNRIKRVFDNKSANNFIFRLNIENDYKNVCSEMDYQYDVFYGKSHEILVNFIIPSIGILVLIIGYVILMSFVIVKNMVSRLAFERVIGKKRIYLIFKVFSSSICEALIFIGISYILSSFISLGLNELNNSFNIGLSIINPYSSFWFYIVFLGMIVFYSLTIMLNVVSKLFHNISSLLK